MEFQKTQPVTVETSHYKFEEYFDDHRDVEARLNALLEVDRENIREKALYRSEGERFEASLIENPLTTQKAFAQFGLMLGTFPPMALFARFLMESHPADKTVIVLLLILVNIVCATVGFFSGKLVGKMVTETEKWSWSKMLLTLPFIGILWGIMAGGAGGIFLFLIGAIFGAIIASIVGGVAVPAFTIFHRWLKKGDVIERDQFLPIALGITFIISAVFLGFPIK